MHLNYCNFSFSMNSMTSVAFKISTLGRVRVFVMSHQKEVIYLPLD